MTVLVTGGAGYIGSHTVIELLNSGNQVIIVDNFYNSQPEVLKRIKELSGKDFKFYEVDVLNKEDLTNPEINIKLGTKYFSTLYETYKNIPIALTAYNAGSGNVDKWLTEETISADGSDIENVPFRETNNYVRKILRDYEIYKDIYAEE